MIYFVDGAYDINKSKWCKENDIFYISFALTFIPVIICFSDKKFDKWMNKLVIFNATDAMAYKLRWS